ncbi:MAG: HAMP domain-containing histidine kinase [Cyclobacteriaceae bacterium]|nr:HAMP domain-containing histidine kinase [Cyclobacteriaceae bacterium]
MQIRSRLTLLFSVSVCALLFLSFLLIYFFADRFNRQQFHDRLNDKAVTSATLLLRVDEVDSALLKTIDRARRDALFGENITVYDQENKEIYTNNDTVYFEITPVLLKSIRSSGKKYFNQRGFEIIGLDFRNEGQHYVVVAGAIDINGTQQLANLRVLLIILFGAMLAIVSIVGWIYAGRALKPVNNLIGEIQAISIDDLRYRISERKYNDEIGKLIIIFNKLLTRIEKAFSLQKAFVSNVSHELKNPLTKITSQLEVTLLKERSLEEYKKTTESVLEDIKDLNMLSGSLLDLAFLHENETVAMTDLRIDEVLWEVLENVTSLNSDYQTEITTLNLPEDEEKLYMSGNLYLLKVAFQNVIENACKFSPDHKANISFNYSGEQFEIRISDNGPGIDQNDLENIFQPFYRADRTSKIKGYGIGLSLSHRIITLHNGTICVLSQTGAGTTVLVSFRADSHSNMFLMAKKE